MKKETRDQQYCLGIVLGISVVALIILSLAAFSNQKDSVNLEGEKVSSAKYKVGDCVHRVIGIDRIDPDEQFIITGMSAEIYEAHRVESKRESISVYDYSTHTRHFVENPKMYVPGKCLVSLEIINAKLKVKRVKISDQNREQ